MVGGTPATLSHGSGAVTELTTIAPAPELRKPKEEVACPLPCESSREIRVSVRVSCGGGDTILSETGTLCVLPAQGLGITHVRVIVVEGELALVKLSA